MTADAVNEIVDEAVETAFTESRPRRMSGKRLVLFFILPILLLGGGAAGLYLSGMLDTLIGNAEEDPLEEEEEPAGPGFFYDLPDILVNLNTGNRRQNFLKIRVSLELENESDVATIERLMPRIIDNFQVYLRELRLEDLRGSAGLYRLREELLRRVSTAAAPAVVRDVLFREMLVQ